LSRRLSDHRRASTHAIIYTFLLHRRVSLLRTFVVPHIAFRCALAINPAENRASVATLDVICRCRRRCSTLPFPVLESPATRRASSIERAPSENGLRGRLPEIPPGCRDEEDRPRSTNARRALRDLTRGVYLLSHLLPLVLTLHPDRSNLIY